MGKLYQSHGNPIDGRIRGANSVFRFLQIPGGQRGIATTTPKGDEGGANGGVLSRELTYPPDKAYLKIFEDDFHFPQVGYVNSLEGI